MISAFRGIRFQATGFRDAGRCPAFVTRNPSLESTLTQTTVSTMVTSLDDDHRTNPGSRSLRSDAKSRTTAPIPALKT